jgi:hypothetical protein
MKPHAAMLLLFAPTLFAQTTTISMNPATPAPNETLTFTVRSTWPNGCVPRFQSITGAGSNTIQINAVQTDCNAACTQVVTPYTIETTPGTIRNPGIYVVEYHVIDCNSNNTTVASQIIAISGTCQFDRALSASATAARVGSSIELRWCDPSVIPGPDQGIGVSFYRVLVSRSANGPFVPLADVNVTHVGLTFDSADLGSLFFFVEAHECNETIAGCTGDTVVRSNIVRVDVVAANACLPDATTLCLNGGRFQVRAQWTASGGNTGPGQAVSMTNDTGYFWFFGADNVELVVKVLNGCALQNPSYWVFASGLTNVGVDLTVTDIQTGTTKTYHNPVNQPFVAIQDTGAFSTCP